MEQDRFTELTWTFLLWGLPQAELAEWEAELERRGEAGRVELHRMRETLAAVALTAPPVAPPPTLREEVLALIRETPAGPAPGRRPTAAEPASVVPFRRRPWEWIVAAAAAASIAAVLAVSNVRLRERLQDVERELAQTLESAGRNLARADSTRAALEAARRDLDAVASPEASVHTLVGTVEQPEARARVFVDPETGRAILFVYDLPVLPPRTVYELWAIKGGTPIAAGTFQTSGESPARVELKDASVLQGADVLAVTIEPAPGVPAPTGRMVLSSPS